MEDFFIFLFLFFFLRRQVDLYEGGDSIISLPVLWKDWGFFTLDFLKRVKGGIGGKAARAERARGVRGV